ncbi:MAG TPA: hypothetical protein VFV07_03120 [Rhizomicrobium sp.]|nr:hypothetical protein [Rhizomicrobium sp.]
MKGTTIFVAAAALALTFSTALASGNAPSDFAVVNSDGSLARGIGATGSSELQTGVYEVDFTKNITTCGYTATIGLSGTAGASDPGTVTVVGRSDNNKAVYVQTFNGKGKPAELGFHLIVQC